MSNHVFDRIPEFKFKEIISNSKSIAQAVRGLGLCVSGDQYVNFKSRIKELNIDISHFKGQYGNLACSTEIPIEKIFTKNNPRAGGTLKRKIIKNNLLPYSCERCSNNGLWLNEPISLQIDHKDGDNSNNELSNLRFLCPNCHTQTSTYAGKKFKRKYFCQNCGEEVCSKQSKHCQQCWQKFSIDNLGWFSTKINWPNKEKLNLLVWSKPLVQLAIDLNCSANGIKKQCKKEGINLPPRGYWQRIKAGYTHEQSLTKSR